MKKKQKTKLTGGHATLTLKTFWPIRSPDKGITSGPPATRGPTGSRPKLGDIGSRACVMLVLNNVVTSITSQYSDCTLMCKNV